MGEPVRADAAAAARSRLYALCAAYSAFPDAESWRERRWLQGLDDLAAVLAALPYRVDARCPDIPASLSAAALNLAYTCTFEAGAGSVSLHEQTYGATGARGLFEELLRCYEHFGLDFEQCRNRFRPDALQVELEFMHYLVYLQLIAPHSEHALLRAQRDFLCRHLRPFCDGVAASLHGGAEPVYAGLFALVGHSMAADARYLSGLLEAD